MPELIDFTDGNCPKCGKPATWNFATRRMECKYCAISGPIGERAAPAARSDDGDAASKRSSIDGIQVIDTYYERVNGKARPKHVSYIVPKVDDNDIPNLYLQLPWVKFHRYRLRDLAALERRWGRDQLRKRGFILVGKRKGVKVYKKPGFVGPPTGRLAWADAAAIIEREWRTTPPPPLYPDDSLEQILADLREALDLVKEWRRRQHEAGNHHDGGTTTR